jgi:hypothetical protein
MIKDNLIIYVSSRNNYDMLSGEVLNNIDMEGFEFINVDDKSSESEIQKGKQICKDNDIVFIENKSRGVQMATQTLIDFINENRPNCKWIICFQHDIYPVSENFFSRLSTLIETNELDDFGGLGFNVLDGGDYSGNSWIEYKNGGSPIGVVGFAHLSISDVSGRWLARTKNNLVRDNPELFSKPFICEFACWPVVGLNVNKWNKFIKPTEDYEFHLWYPDIAMQFNYNNCPIIVLPNLYCYNDQMLKEKYGIYHNSAVGAKNGDEYHFGNYGNHFINWKKRWGWGYESVFQDFESVKDNYVGTLIYKYFNHTIENGPLKTYDLVEY